MKSLLKHAARFGPEAVGSIRETVAMLPAGQGAELAEPGVERRTAQRNRIEPHERIPDMTHGSAGRLVPLMRFAEVCQALVAGRLPPYLLATPTRVDGLLDAGTLVGRMEGYERDGVVPLPLDLRQAPLLASFLVDGPDAGGVRPLLYAAASGGLPGAELGRQIVVLPQRGQGSPAGVLASLRVAAESGAHREVWEVMAGLLEAYPPEDGEPATPVHTRMMSFAAEVADWADARGEVAAVAKVAARRRTSELVRQARTPHARLTGETG